MQNNYLRHLGYLLYPEERTMNLKYAVADITAKKKMEIPPEFNPKDCLTFMLHIDAELEHSLMVQYLYAAYSLGGDHVAPADKERLRGWQEIILGIAKEEMGHFVSIQNVLRVLGAPLNFNRQDFPWDSKMYPFEFKLEPFTLSSLAKYIYAESPKGWLTTSAGDDKETKEIKKEIREFLSADKQGDPISVLFEKIIELLEDTERIPDNIFLPETYQYQAKFDEWGRAYANGARGNSGNANLRGAPNVLVTPLSSRTDTIEAIRGIAEQGEATTGQDNLSHFNRFLNIYKEWRKLPKGFQASRNMAINPTIAEEITDDTSDFRSEPAGNQKDLIKDPVARIWANLFNVRYRMLLTFLTHSFLIGDGFDSSVNSPRGTIIHATFGEMYNLRSIANVLVNIPLSDGSRKMAGPPFLIPYTMDLPIGEINRWRLHQNLIEASEDLIVFLLNSSDKSYHKYLLSLREADEKFNEIAEKITAALA